ncbi:NTP/NDP exchange transporter [Anaeromyxobacter sp. Fw109-5]|uniref:NTP/NDP exchange transporter n=1 Tax=Anaeromyxobacter sp. (strain Fw109-5) TaxID=404589 RepID=UPI0000ED7AC2|nr:MFS transporter [Anaeromyxobacter sp. Fw109-5]ABS24249.1 major facilitator superfamily MFS_1 [Anaeromyxobacter sp. Fw109-5]
MAAPARAAASALHVRLTRLVQVEPGEVRALLWSFAYFFSLLCGYYIVRPMRDAMGIAGGVEQLHWLFTGTFVAMLAAVPLFGWVTSRFPRRRFLPLVYYFFIANLLVFYALLAGERGGVHAARAFFIWTSVYNLFVVSVFWSFMADLYTNAQARRLFGFIAAGGTIGALVGPALATALARPLGNASLLLLSAGFMGVAVLCVHRLIAWKDRQRAAAPGQARAAEARPLGGGVLAAVPLVLRSPYLLGIALFMLLFTTASTVLYFQQAEIVRDAFASAAERTAVFGAMDLAVNALTVGVQVLLTGRLVRVLGVAGTLALVPALLGLGFLALAFAPVLPVIVAVQVLRRAGDYAVTRPARELLYVVLGREEKYKAKSFVDTVVYRGGDALSAWAYAGLRALGASLGAIAWLAVPVAGCWAWLAYRLGRRQEALAATSTEGGAEWRPGTAP